MNPVLENKLAELKSASDYECWYLVKQPTEFDNLCYLVSFLKEYQKGSSGQNLQDYISKKVSELEIRKPELKISNNYRALRVAAFFGLITMKSSKYDDAVITETFDEVTTRCNGAYEHIELYSDIVQRQIEKMFLSSQIDEAYIGVRKSYRLYPIMLLYKVLLEIGRSTGSYSITMTEYRYFVTTTKTFEGFLDTLLLIKLLRQESEKVKNEFEKYRTKFDNRLIRALKQLKTLKIDKDLMSLNSEFIDEVAKKVFIFEQNPDKFQNNDYLEFLASSKSLFDIQSSEIESDKENTNIQLTEKEIESGRLQTGTNILLYGVPGAGKSYTIQKEYCNDESRIERLVFHPDYTYSDFIGQILPDVSEGTVTYRFTSGPFTNILKRAYEEPKSEFFLIIEEINRGNAPAIFGEVFQLLDRKSGISENDDGYPVGTSEYGITNTNIARIVYGDPQHKVRIPSNLSIIGTMNTSDQNVFTLDTAFQRRWSMRLIDSSFENVEDKFRNHKILDTSITWEGFCEGINTIILERNTGITSAEDKRIGPYFIHLSDLKYDPIEDDETFPKNERLKAMRHNTIFAEKVIKYLWDDAFKFSRADIFDIENKPYFSLERIIKIFAESRGNARFSMFKEDIVNKFSR